MAGLMEILGNIGPQLAFGERGVENEDSVRNAPQNVPGFASVFPDTKGGTQVDATTFDKAMHAQNSMKATERLARLLHGAFLGSDGGDQPAAIPRELAAAGVDTMGQIREGGQMLMGMGKGERAFSPSHEIAQGQIRGGLDSDDAAVRANIDQDQYDDNDMLANQLGTRAANNGNLSAVSDPGGALERLVQGLGSLLQGDGQGPQVDPYSLSEGAMEHNRSLQPNMWQKGIQ